MTPTNVDNNRRRNRPSPLVGEGGRRPDEGFRAHQPSHKQKVSRIILLPLREKVAEGRMRGSERISHRNFVLPASSRFRRRSTPHPALRATFSLKGRRTLGGGFRGSRRIGLVAVVWGLVIGAMLVPAVGAEDLTVRVRARLEKVLVGQGVELFVDVPARGKRPMLEAPAVRGGRMWVVDESFRPTGMSSIGGSVSSDNIFTTRYRLVATAPGRLDVPPIVARLGDETGRSRPLRLSVEPPPIAGRPPGFLGGVGDFHASAEVEPAQVRVGQEATYRIRIDGPGAWGMATAPELGRLRGLAIEPRVDGRPDETIDEPPSRAFVFRVRPMKAGEVVLPPVTIASFDPRIGRYVTRATNGVPLKVVAVPEFDAEGLDYRPPSPPSATALWIVAAGAAVMVAGGVFAFRRRLARLWRRAFPVDRRAAKRHARETARRFGEAEDATPDEEAARRTMDALAEFARLSVGRPPGAMTPDEAASAVSRASGSEELGRRAAGIAARCDRILFAARGSGGGSEAGDRLVEDARELFEALGRGGGRWGRGWG